MIRIITFVENCINRSKGKLIRKTAVNLNSSNDLQKFFMTSGPTFRIFCFLWLLDGGIVALDYSFQEMLNLFFIVL